MFINIWSRYCPMCPWDQCLVQGAAACSLHSPLLLCHWTELKTDLLFTCLTTRLPCIDLLTVWHVCSAAELNSWEAVQLFLYEVGLFLSLPTSQPFLLTLQAAKLKSCTVGDTPDLCKVLLRRIPESYLGVMLGIHPDNITRYAVGLHAALAWNLSCSQLLLPSRVFESIDEREGCLPLDEVPV
jgi:hypothetical protein